MNKPTLYQRFSAFIKGGEEKDVTRFETKLFDRLEKEISDRKTKISDLKEHIVDAKSSLNDAVFNIDPERIKGIDAAKSYTATYLTNLQNAMNKVEEYEGQIEVLEAEIKQYNKIKQTIENAEAPKAEK